MRRVLAFGIGGLVAAAASSLPISTCNGRQKDKDAARETRYQSALTAINSWEKRYDSVLKASKIDSKRVEALKVANGLLRNQIDSKANSADLKGKQIAGIQIPKTASDTIWKTLYYLRTAENDDNKEQVVLLRSYIANDSAQMNILTKQRDAALAIAAEARVLVPQVVAVAIEQHDKKECVFALFFPCPSRKVTAVGGAALGIAGTLVVRNAIK